jgi:hypothetical protein
MMGRGECAATYHLLHQEGLEIGFIAFAVVRSKILGLDSLEESIANTLREAFFGTANEAQLIVDNVMYCVARMANNKQQQSTSQYQASISTPSHM